MKKATFKCGTHLWFTPSNSLPHVAAKSCFSAIKQGLVTAQTRFLSEQRELSYRIWRHLKVGTIVLMYSGRYDIVRERWNGDSLAVEVTKEPRAIDFTKLTARQRAQWSKQEGWSDLYIDSLIERGKTQGTQVCFRLYYVPPPKVLAADPVKKARAIEVGRSLLEALRADFA